MKRDKEHARNYQTFEDLELYQVAREFRKAMYRVAKQLPEIEKFGLASQVRRAALSLTNNIAEGHGRYHFLDQIEFMLQSRGSLEEILDDLNVCQDEQYLSISEIEKLKLEAWRVHKLNGYIRFLRSRTVDKSPRLQESPDNELGADDFGDVIRFNRSILCRFNP